MKKTFLILWALFLCSVQALKAQDSSNPFVHCLVLDKTMSMTGHGGTDIWADVQNYCYEWIDGVPEPSTIPLFTFDKNIYGPQKFEINSASDKEKAKDAVRNINVDGRNTWISFSLDKAIKHVYDNYSTSHYNRRIYLITDGKEEQPGADLASVLHNYESWKGDYDYLYYVDLRDMAPQDVANIIDDTDDCSIVKGFAKFLTITPLFKTVNCVLGGSKSFEQHFLIDNETLFSEMKFSLRIDSIKKRGTENVVPNVTITPSVDINKQMAQKLENGKYKVKFSLDFRNESTCECDIFVGLPGCSQSDKVLRFQPGGFVIQARNKPAPKVTTKKGMGWH